MRKFLFVIAVVSFATLGVFSPFATDTSKALTGWKAGRIIDDSVFTAYTSMSSSQIQSFLNLKVKSCDTNGTKPSEMNNSGVPDYSGDGTIQRWEWGKKKYNQTKFVCLKDYVKDGKKASQIIYEKARKYKISPKVLIVLLQKEQGLVTDTWPLNVQYRSATGYGCPDTAPCDSQYYGLVNQLDWSAKMFRAILDDSSTWYTPYNLGNNYIQYNPSASCGGKTVNIENRATQALYNYTPYTPNKAALDAGWGTAPCGAYGNRNFFLYFTEWFGSVRGSNLSYLIKCSETYYIGNAANNKKYPISLDGMEDWGINEANALVDNYLCSMATGSTVITNIVRSASTGKLYLVDAGNAYYLPSQALADDWGINDIASTSYPSISADIINQYLNVFAEPPILAESANPDRTDVYIIDNQTRYRLLGSDIGNTTTTRLITGYDSTKKKTISVDLLQTFAAGSTFNYAFSNGGKLYLFNHGEVFEVSNSSATTLWSSHIGASEVVPITNSVLQRFSRVAMTTGFRKDDYFYQLTLAGNFRKTKSSNIAVNWGVSNYPTSTNMLRDTLLSGAVVSTSNELNNNVRLISCSGTKYIVERDRRYKRAITSYAETAWGFNAYYFFNNDRGCSYPLYGMNLDKAVRSRNTDTVYYVSGKKAYPVTNATTAASYGIGDPATTTFPYMESTSILDNLTIIR